MLSQGIDSSRKSTYLAATVVAGTVETHFAKQLAAAQHREEKKLAKAPSKQVIEEILDTAFWASLRHEEGQSPRISLAFLPPDQAGSPVLFEHRLPLSPDTITKIAPGVNRPGIHLGVWHEEDELIIWGATRTIPSLCFVVDVSEPGLLVIKYRRMGGYGKYLNLAVLRGDQIMIVDESSAALPDCPHFVSSLLGFTSLSTWNSATNVLVQLAVSMRAHGNGGSLLVVPAGTDKWRKSIIHPISYAVQPAFSGLGKLMQEDEEQQREPVWQAALRQQVDSIAGLTAVDGATIISDNYDLLAFGAKIGRAADATSVDKVMLTEPVLGNKPDKVHPSQNGGTRHFSAAQFVHDQRDAIALVASQDGRFTIFSWSPCENMVQAHRIDTLLL